MAETLTGDQLRRSIGLRNLFQFGPGFFGNVSYEQLDTVVGEPGASRPDGNAATVAATWVPSDRWRLTARVENRDEDALDTWLHEFGVATEIGRDFSLVGRARYFETEPDQAERREDFRTSLGLAWRPTSNDRLQVIARLDWWQQDRPVGIGAFEEGDKRYGSIEGMYQFSDRFSLSARYAGKLYQLAPHELYTDLVAARGAYLITGKLELGLTARLLNEHDFDNRTLGGAVDVGYNVWKSLWVTAGYSFDDFDLHLRGDGHSGQGGYVKLRFKFDENTLQSLLGR
jgi:large repetitive protein